MHCVKTCSDVTSTFANTLTYPSYRYPPNFLKNNFAFPKVTNQDIKYLSGVLHFGKTFCRAMRKNFKSLLCLKQNGYENF